MRLMFVAGAIALALAGCQSTSESYANAEQVCLKSGLKQGTAKYNKCIQASYDNNRRNSDAATSAAVAGAAAGVIDGTILGVAASNNSRYGYGYGYGYRCNRWGCW